MAVATVVMKALHLMLSGGHSSLPISHGLCGKHIFEHQLFGVPFELCEAKQCRFAHHDFTDIGAGQHQLRTCLTPLNCSEVAADECAQNTVVTTVTPAL